MSNKFFIIIITYNGIKWVPKCLKRTRPYPVIIVDNNSTDGTLEFIKNNYPEIKLFGQKKNLGFGQANNIGISYALEQGAKHFFLLNQDAYLEPGCIERLIKAQIRSPEYGILSPLQLNGQGDRLDQRFTYYLNYQANPDFFSDYALNKPKKEIYDVPFMNAAGWLLSKTCVEKVGGFDPIFFHYGEDDNYCQRVHYYGFNIGVCPEAILLHDREDRFEPEISFGEKKYFESMEKHSKLKYADINKPLNSELDNFINKRKRAWLKATLKFDFKTAYIFRKEYRMLQNIKLEIIKSRAMNKAENLNYLKVRE